MTSIAPQTPSSEQGATPTSVYRYYDAVDMLIYVGITRQGIGRNLQHNGRAEWWPFVVRQEVEHHPNRPTAAAREKDLIRQFRPPFNKQHNPDYAEAHAAYLAFVATYGGRVESAPGLYNVLGKKLPLDLVDCDLRNRKVVFRSQLPHGPLATTIKWNKEQPALRGRRRKYGHVSQMEVVGPFLTIHCRVNQHTPEEGFSGAEALLGWANNDKPQHAWIRQVLATEADFIPKSKVVKYGADTLIVRRAV